jgi:hypothetical protein
MTRNHRHILVIASKRGGWESHSAGHGSGGHYGSADHEYALIEAEYYERHL